MKRLTPVIIVVMICLLYGLESKPVLALNGFIDPSADGSTGNWTSTGGNFFGEVLDASRQPTTPTTSTNITAAANNGGSIYLNMNSITGVTTVSDIEVWVHHNDGSNGQIEVQLYDDDEATTRSSALNLAQSATSTWSSVNFTGLSLTQAELDTLSIRLTAGKNGGGQPATITVHALYADVTYTNVVPAYDQSGYRFFNSINSTDVGTPLAGVNSNGVLNASGDEFRLRLLIHVTVANVNTSAQSFKLQFAGRGNGSCASPSGGTPATYTDVTGATIIAYNNLTAGVSDGDALTTSGNDPTHGGDTVVAQTVEEANNFTNSQGAINIGQDGLWDFALIDNGAPAATAYCLRVVLSDGSLLDTYGQYPTITTGNGVLSVDIVNATGTPVASPAFAMSASGYAFTCDPSTTQIGANDQRVRVSNFTATPSWTVTMAATAGATATWSDGGTEAYDFNDGGGSPAGCSDSGDVDTLAGQLSLNPAVATIGPLFSCSTTGLSLGTASAFAEATVDIITLITSSSGSPLGCAWDVTGINASQYIPQDQASGNYSMNFTLTATAI